MTEKVNWLTLEDGIREALKKYALDREKSVANLGNAEATLFAIDEIIAEETGRGHAIEGENDWDWTGSG